MLLVSSIKKIWDSKVFTTIFFSFFVIHGEMIFNKISWWDDIAGAFGPGPEFNAPLPHGRWFCTILARTIYISILDNPISPCPKIA